MARSQFNLFIIEPSSYISITIFHTMLTNKQTNRQLFCTVFSVHFFYTKLLIYDDSEQRIMLITPPSNIFLPPCLQKYNICTVRIAVSGSWWGPWVCPSIWCQVGPWWFWTANHAHNTPIQYIFTPWLQKYSICTVWMAVSSSWWGPWRCPSQWCPGSP